MFIVDSEVEPLLKRKTKAERCYRAENSSPLLFHFLQHTPTNTHILNAHTHSANYMFSRYRCTALIVEPQVARAVNRLTYYGRNMSVSIIESMATVSQSFKRSLDVIVTHLLYKAHQHKVSGVAEQKQAKNKRMNVKLQNTLLVVLSDNIF